MLLFSSEKWDSGGEAVYSAPGQLESTSRFPPLRPAPEESNWYAIHTMARHEKRVAAQFEEKRVRAFLPLLRQTHTWSDRQSKVDVPMFSCYAFVRIVQTVEERLKVLRTPGVLGFVGSERQGTPIPEEQIESLRIAIGKSVPCFPHAFITAGRRVRIRGGSLDGVEGILIRRGADQSLVLSVELLLRSVAIRVEGYDIELV
jgi:transcription antitermination factor NusG